MVTGWIGKDNGLLVRHINKNGQIDNGDELLFLFIDRFRSQKQ